MNKLTSLNLMTSYNFYFKNHKDKKQINIDQLILGRNVRHNSVPLPSD